MHVLKKIERSFRAVVPRGLRHAVLDRCRRLTRAIRDGRPPGAWRESSAGPRGPGLEPHAGPPTLTLVVLAADPVERSRLAARLDGAWCRVADPHDYEPCPGDYVHFPEPGGHGLSIPELRLLSLSLAHEPNDFVVVSRAIAPPPAVAARSLRDACVIRADRHGCLLDPAGRWPRMRGRVLRLLTNRSPADAETSMDRLLGTRCRTQGPHVFVGGPFGRQRPAARQATPCLFPPATGRDDRPLLLVLPALFAVGGVERNTVEVLKELQDRYRFVVVTNEPHEPARGSLHAQLAGLCEAVYDLGEAADFAHHASMLASLHACHRFDCVWIVNGSPWLSRHLAEVRGLFAEAPIVDQQVYDTEHGWISCYRDPAIHTFDRHIAINSRIAERFVRHFGLPAERVDLVYHAIDSRKWEAVIGDERRRVRARQRLGVAIGAAVYGFVGRLTEQKRPLDFLELARGSAAEGRPDLFVMVGDGPLAADCREHVRRHGLTNVRFSGFVDDPADLLLAFSGLVITSAYEGLPIVSLEAMAIGLPILATDVGDLRLVAETHGAAVSFWSGADHATRAREFRRWAESLPEETARARAAAAGVRDAFGADRIANRYDEVFRTAMTARSVTATSGSGAPCILPARRDQTSVSIVMPTFNRRERLARVLDRYDEVARAVDHEIVIVDDGSTDGTAEWLADRARRDPRLRHLRLENGGPGRARNTGAAVATKEVVLFVGDDILPCDDRFLATHARLHAAHPETGFAVLGKVVWPADGSLDVTPVMRHIQGVGGEQFGYPHFRPYQSLDWRFFYTCNVSVKRGIVADWQAEGFASEFTAAAFEDVEFAYRMAKRAGGLRIYYDPASLGEHHHPHSVRSFLDRQFNAGSMASVLIARHPETAGVLGLKRLGATMREEGRHGANGLPDPLPVADLLSVIEGAKSLAMLLESFGGLGDSLWHTPFLQAVFELAMLQGFVVGEASRGGDAQAGYRAILGTFLRRVEPIAATELPGSRGLVDSLRSRLAA